MQTNDQELLENSTMAPFPAGKAGSYCRSGSWSWSIFKTSKNVDGAKDLILYLMDPKRLQTVYEAGRRALVSDLQGRPEERVLDV